MTMERNDTIRRREDGCIDTAYYLQRGRVARSQMAYRLPGDIGRLARRLFDWLKVIIDGERTAVVSSPARSETKLRSGDASNPGITLKNAA